MNVILASGQNELLALPKLMGQRGKTGQVLIPPNNGFLRHAVVNLVEVAFGSYDDVALTVLVDTHEQPARDAIGHVKTAVEGLSGRPDISFDAIRYVAVVPHLEGWFFGDANGLSAYLGEDAGTPGINPKRTLSGLLVQQKRLNYSSRLAEDIARRVDANTIYGNCRSFRDFIDGL